MTDSTSSEREARPRVLLCRDCCCGTTRKHPDVDHDAQLAALSAVARTRIVSCVNECSRSNVVIVRFGDERAIWLEAVNSETVTNALCDWISARGADPPPLMVRDKVFVPKNQLRAEDRHQIVQISKTASPQATQ